MQQKIVKFLALSLFVTACSSVPPTSQRGPASVSPATGSIDLLSLVEGIRSEIRGDALTASNCGSVLKHTYQELEALTPGAIDVQRLKRTALEAARNLFYGRLELRAKLKAMEEQSGRLPGDCVDGARNLLRAMRATDDFVAEWKMHPSAYDKKSPYPYLAGRGPYLQINPAYEGFNIGTSLKSGDLIMSRGNAYTSAAIARLSDSDAQYSHVAMVYIDEKTGQRYVLEAHIEVGSTVRPFEEYAQDGNMRAVVFRQPDAALAHAAAKLMYYRVRNAQAKGENIPYDFTMSMAVNGKLFCSKLPHEGFLQASDGKFFVPRYLSSYRAKNRDLLDRLGIQDLDSFAPADLEVDARFDVVAEWRDLSRLTDVRMKDAALIAYYDFMERENYVLHGNVKAYAMEKIVWRARRWPLFSSLLKKKFPLNMTPTVLGTITMLDEVAETFYDELAKLNEQVLAKRGMGLTPGEMAEALEAFRLRDLQTYRIYQEWLKNRTPDGHLGGEVQPPLSKFHSLFRARD